MMFQISHFLRMANEQKQNAEVFDPELFELIKWICFVMGEYVSRMENCSSWGLLSIIVIEYRRIK